MKVHCVDLFLSASGNFYVCYSSEKITNMFFIVAFLYCGILDKILHSNSSYYMESIIAFIQIKA